MAASARISCPLATSYLAVSVQDLMAADKRKRIRARWDRVAHHRRISRPARTAAGELGCDRAAKPCDLGCDALR